MAGRLAGKTTLITAAGAGIGRASAIAFANEGATVYATDVNDKLFADYPKLPNLHTSRLDVLDDAAVRKMIGELPPLQALFNCAGYVHNGSILECTDDQWNFAFNLNVRAMYVAAKAAIPKMVDHFEKTGTLASIINIASIASSIKGLPNRFVYGTSKAAVIGLTQVLALELAGDQILVNAVAPGPILAPPGTTDDELRAVEQATPLGRWGGGGAIARAVQFLIETDFVTGEVIRVDGGRHVK